MSSSKNDLDKLLELESKIKELELKLETERKLNAEKTAIMKKTIAETEDLARHLQNTTLALIQERQIANARAEKEKLINKWIEKINSTFDLDALLTTSVAEIGEFLIVDRCGLILFHKEQIFAARELTTLNHRRLSGDDKINSLESIEPEELKKSNYIRKIQKSRKRLIESHVTDVGDDKFMTSAKSILAFPMVIKKELVGIYSGQEYGQDQALFDEMIGVFYLQQCDEHREWQEKEIDLLKSINIPLSTAIEKSLLYLDARKRTEYAELLNSLTTQIRSSLNLNEILARTVNELGLALRASRCFLYFDGYISDEYCEDGVHSIAESTKFLIFDKYRSDKSFKPIAIDNLLDERYFSKLSEEEQQELISSKAVSALACPLHFQGILQGWIVFHSFKKRQWSGDEISFVEAAGSQVIVAMTQSRMYEKLNSYQEKLSRELKQAARVQTSLIGGDVFDVNLETSVFYKAHSNVSGDFYWIAELAPDTIGVLIGDVSGKGPAAALLTGYLLGEFNAAVANSALAWFPERLISFLCQSILYQNASSDFYATAWYGVFNLHTGKLRYTNAGHLNPYLIINNQVIELDKNNDSGVPLGLINPKEIEEAYIAKEIDFQQGDKMLLFTDGVLDQKMPDGNFVPKNWILKTLEKIKEKDVKEITFELNETLNNLSGATPLTDDRLMISLEGVYFDIFEFVAQDNDKTGALIDQIIKECIENEMPKEKQLNLRLGITEALSNAVRYGLSKNPSGCIRLGYKVSKNVFKMSIIDPGPGFNWQVYNYTAIEDVMLDNEGGRGIPLLMEIFNKVTWNHVGNHLGLFYYW
ncbi:MAG: SpoIIE family protein phosphatase [Candidatus Caenarcaniphilales bacterium]|jgi:serine phosphatase RsbU (regulator of sigma subunit)/anti-sigma regulatory factor (Ser/Thr protein kinase)|nr:SpoIIE family protein phosphatase [Candidatus Caenarcaniphilales bacterium]